MQDFGNVENTYTVSISKKLAIVAISFIVLFSLSTLYLFASNTVLRNRIISKCANSNEATSLKCNNIDSELEKYKSVYDNLTYPPAVNSLTFAFWYDYIDANIKFKYPTDWGMGSECEGELRENYIGLGPNLLDFPGSNCGTANIPAHIEIFFIDKFNIPDGYEVIKKDKIVIDDIDSSMYLLMKKELKSSGSILLNITTIPIKNKILIVQLNGSTNFINYKNIYDKLLTTIRIPNTTNKKAPESTESYRF